MPKVRKDIANLDRYSRASSLDDKYPYLQDCLDGNVHELVAGKDFTTKTETMRQGLKEWGKRNAVDLSVKTEGKNVLIQVRKTPAKRKTPKRKPRR